MPLVVITTNEERELPPAFVRRCAVLNLNPPKDGAEFRTWLVDRGRVHKHLSVEETVRERAAQQVAQDRGDCDRVKYPPVGLAEYIDLLHALHELVPDGPASGRRGGDAAKAREAAQHAMLDRLSRYALVKQPDQDQRRSPVAAPSSDDDRGPS
jgi:MoxR-like ATPase